MLHHTSGMDPKLRLEPSYGAGDSTVSATPGILFFKTESSVFNIIMYVIGARAGRMMQPRNRTKNLFWYRFAKEKKWLGWVPSSANQRIVNQLLPVLQNAVDEGHIFPSMQGN